MIKIYHYSDIDFSGYIKPDFFGYNSYTQNSGRISRTKRSFFYLDAISREYYFNGVKFLYIAKVDEKKLYNLDDDVLKLAGQGNIYDKIKKAGYIGVIGNNGYNSGILFYPTKILEKKVL